MRQVVLDGLVRILDFLVVPLRHALSLSFAILSPAEIPRQTGRRTAVVE